MAMNDEQALNEALLEWYMNRLPADERITKEAFKKWGREFTKSHDSMALILGEMSGDQRLAYVDELDKIRCDKLKPLRIAFATPAQQAQAAVAALGLGKGN